MTLITDAKKLLKDCQQLEKSIYDHLSFGKYPDNIVLIQYDLKYVPIIMNVFRGQLHHLLDYETGSKIFKDCSRMVMRLEAAVMYAKKHCNLEDPMVKQPLFNNNVTKEENNYFKIDETH